MANTGYTSPFPTSHDTIGQSTLVTPLFMPSSPPQRQTSQTPPESPGRPESPISDHFNPHSDDEQHDNNEDELHHFSHRTKSPTGSDLDARLAEHTLDFDNMPLPDLNIDMEERLSDVGGPEDFTANLEDYFLNGRKSTMKKPLTQQEDVHSGSAVRQSSLRSQQPAAEDYGDSAEYSEFGPPVDMSTPSHVLHRTSALAKDSTHLHDIEEDPADALPSPESRSSRRMSTTSRSAADEREQGLQERIAQLEDELHDRDEQILNDRRRLRDASASTEQIRHLQAELQRKNDHILIVEAKNSDQKVLRDQIQSLKAQLEEQNKQPEQPEQPEQPNSNELDFESLKQQLHEMQQLLKSQDQHASLDAERLETISHLRKQLDHSQDQLKKRDATLESTLSQLREVQNFRETDLLEKNTEIDRLQADLDHMNLENERLDTELDRANADYEALEDRLTNLETKNQPLEERNQSLEADLTRVQSQVEARENALKSMAADLPLGNRSTYSEILDLINDLGPPESDITGEHPPLEDRQPANSEVQTLRDEIAKLEQAIQDASGGQKAAQAEAGRLREQGTEMQSLIKTIEAENLRLTKRVEEITTTLNITQHDLTRTQEEHAESLETIARLKEDLLAQPPSPPPSPPKANNDNGPDTAALEEAHQTQIKSLKTAHSTAISTLRTSHTESMRKIRNRLAEAEKREADLRIELTSLRASVSTTDSQIRKYKTEIKRLEEVIEIKEDVSAEVDKRVALSVQKREREWQRRVDLLLKDRDQMARVLMQYWGEKEMGPGPGPLSEDKENRHERDRKQSKEKRREDGEKKQASKGQAYRYKFVQKPRSKSKERSA